MKKENEIEARIEIKRVGLWTITVEEQSRIWILMEIEQS